MTREGLIIFLLELCVNYRPYYMSLSYDLWCLLVPEARNNYLQPLYLKKIHTMFTVYLASTEEENMIRLYDGHRLTPFLRFQPDD